MNKYQNWLATACMAWIGVCFLPQYAAAQPGGQKCHSVRFDMLFEPDVPPPTVDFSATFSGDLEGTAEILLLSATEPTGITNTAVFHFVWTITGGKVDALIGTGFETMANNRNLPNMSFDPDNPFDAPVAYVVGKHRAESGVQRANLTYIGEAMLTEDGRFQAELRHRGVICLH